MTTPVQEETSQVTDLLAELGSTGDFDAGPAAGGNRWSRWAVRLVLAAALVGLIGLGGYAISGRIGTESSANVQTHVAKRGELLVTITEDGNLQSADNVDIKCEVAGGSTILWIVEDGKQVKEGEELFRLDSSQLEEQINQQRITYEKARASQIQAEKDYAAAKIAVQEYEEGTFRQQLQDQEAQITIAMENLRSAENSLQHTQRMFRKGYVSPLQLETQGFAVERAKLDLASAKTAKDVLERFTKAKTLQTLESQRDAAEARMRSEKASLDLEEGKLKRLEGNLKKCVGTAPKGGMVVYANEQGNRRFGQQGAEIKEGASVRDQQTILRLPDLSRMQVKVTVHESKVEKIRRGMAARIGIQGRDFHGRVVSVATQPEPSSFFSAGVKEYATVVRIDGEATELRPGMTAEVEILIADLKDVIAVPVAAVFEQNGNAFCCVMVGEKLEKRPVLLGQGNDKSIEVKDGINEGEEVVLNPRSVLTELHQEQRPESGEDAKDRFGTKRGEAGAPDAAARPGTGGADDAKTPGGPGQPRNGPGETPSPPGGPGDATRKTSGKRMDLMQLDKDGDGRVSRQEAPERMSGFFDRIDTNGDGFLDRAEIDAMRSRKPSGAPQGEK